MASNLSITYRVEMLRCGLITSEAELRALIVDAMAQNKTALLPNDLRVYGAELMRTGKIKPVES